MCDVMSHWKSLPSLPFAVLGFPSVISTSSYLISHPCHWFGHSHRLGYVIWTQPTSPWMRCHEALCPSLMDMKLCMECMKVGWEWLCACALFSYWTLSAPQIIPTSTGTGLPEVAHVLCVQVLVCAVMFLVGSIMWSAFRQLTELWCVSKYITLCPRR